MKGDFSRFTFNSKNRYSRVLMQQGRVQLDADWNEQLDISAYRTETEITDFIGQSGAPEHPKNGDQSISFHVTTNENGDEILIGKGRYYIEGMLFENDNENEKENYIKFTAQPDIPGEALPTADGFLYLAYLDVWQHHVTALEVPTLREAALGGADTTTRVKNVWRVKLHALKAGASSNPGDYASGRWQPDWEIPMSTGKLTARVNQPGAIVENQLYRVEIHQGNEASETSSTDGVSFKWSRDNGAIAARVESRIDDHNIIIKNAGRDTQLAFPIGQLVEFSNASLTLRGEPGILATVEAIQGNRLTVKWKTADNSPPKNLKDLIIVRRWDSKDAIAIGNPNQEHELEQSITITFESNKLYKTGDYWLIPSRALTGGIEWSPETQRSHGIQHRYCSLALIRLDNNKKFSVLADCRSIFKPITSGLVSKAGDTMTGNLTIDRNLYVTGNVGIGYNDTNQTAALAVNGNVGIGTATPEAYTTAKLVVKSKNSNGGTAQSNPESVLSLTRDGVSGQSWSNIVDFRIGRYDDGLTAIDIFKGNLSLRSRTQLDIVLAHGNYDAPLTKEWSQNIMTLRSNGNVGIGTTAPTSMLSVAGGVAIGSDYASSNPSPTDGLIVKGNVGIGTTSPQARLEISGLLSATENNQSLTALHIKSTFEINEKAGIKQNGLIVENGNVGIGTVAPDARLEVRGGITKLQQEDWIDVILPPNKRADREFGLIMASCFKDSVGIVHLRGTITWTVPKGQDIFTLPDGYKPQSLNIQTVWIEDRSNDINGTYSTGSIFIKPSGGVSLNFSLDSQRLYIDGITFRAA
jgi:hypothetical protein